MASKNEAASRQPVTDCNRLGNAAAMREALRGLLEIVCIDCNSSYKVDGKCVKCQRMVAAESALSEPLRNCDVYTVGEALRKYGFPTKIKPWGEKEWLDFCEWLVSEVEGETKGE